MKYLIFIAFLGCDFGPSLNKTTLPELESSTSNTGDSNNSSDNSLTNFFSWSLVDIMAGTNIYSLSITLSNLENSATIIINSGEDLSLSNFEANLITQCSLQCSVQISYLPDNTGTSYPTFVAINLNQGTSNVFINFPAESISTNTGTIKKNQEALSISIQKN